jgi:hypothetical protein
MEKNFKYIVVVVLILVIGGVLYLAANKDLFKEQMNAVETGLLDRGNYGLYGQNFKNENEDGRYSSFTVMLIDNPADFKKFWSEYIRLPNTGGFEKEPDVNFDENYVVAMLQGIKNSGGYYMNSNSVQEGNKTILVNVNLFVPGNEEANTMVVSSPYEIIKVKKNKDQDFKQKKLQIADGNQANKIIYNGKVVDVLNKY